MTLVEPFVLSNQLKVAPKVFFVDVVEILRTRKELKE